MAKLKIGVIGVGGVAEAHIGAYRNNPHAELCAFCDVNEELLKKKGEKYGVTHLYTDVEEMVKNEKLDAVSVCTLNCAHAKCTIAALNAGIHVLCEKPMAMCVKEAEEMKAAAEKNGKLLMIGFVRRYDNNMDILQDFMKDGFFGDIYYAKASYIRRNGNPGGWFCDKSRSGGGPLMDLGVHVIDYVRYALGNPKPVSVYAATFSKLGNRSNLKTPGDFASADRKPDELCDVEDFATALIRFDNGAVLNVETSFSLHVSEDREVIELYGDKGGAKIDPELKLYSETNGYMTDINLQAETTLDFNGRFQREIDHFINCVLGNSECRSPAEDGIEVMKILDSAYESAKLGHEVVIK